MKKTICLCGLALAVGIPAAFAADHLDSPTVKDEPTADITDLYSWMSPDAAMVNIVLNVAPFAGKSAQYSSAVQYAVHVNSSAGYGEAQTEATIVCQFYKEDAIECWLNDTYVVGDPTKAAGIMSDDGKLKVFAGLRDDPFFFELGGFSKTAEMVRGAIPALVAGGKIDAQGCPALDPTTGAALRGQLMSGVRAEGMGGAAPASDSFAGQNVLSLVLQVNKDLLTAGGPLLGVWASTHNAGGVK